MKKLITALALIVLLLVPLTWWRGRMHTDGLALITPAGNLHAVGVHRGQVLVLITDIPIRPRGEGVVKLLSPSADAFDQMMETLQRNDTSRVNALGVRATTGNAAIRGLSPAGGRTLVIVPPWVPCLVAGVMLLAARPKRGYPAGHCGACGYDVRGSRERCPECGTPIAEFVGPVVGPEVA